MGSAAGVEKTSAARVGVSVEEYRKRIDAGEKWCIGCKSWHDRAEFATDRSRTDGLTAACRAYRSQRNRDLYEPRPRPARGRRFVRPRDGDTRQARGRVNYLVTAGLIPDPNDVPCSDCGHVWEAGQRRHEYDHHLGYSAEHHEHVESVCTTCHHARETERRAA